MKSFLVLVFNAFRTRCELIPNNFRKNGLARNFLIAKGISIINLCLIKESKYGYPIKLSSPPSPDNATVTYCFVTLLRSNDGNAELSAKGSS